jgi:type I restriction enzyme M protein
LAANGVATIVEFPGVLYRSGAEQKIRKYLIDNNFIDCVIQLPADLFFGTTIATCIIVLKKNKTETKTLFIDASNLSVRSDAKNKLTDENIETILKAFTERKDVEYFSKLIDNTEIANNDYKLSVSKYVIKEDTREVIDIKVLNKQLKDVEIKQNELRKAK